MAIRTQQSEIPLVGFPVFETSCPYILPIFWANLFAWVDVVYIKCAVIVKSAHGTLPSKFFNKRQFSLPVARAFMDAVSVVVPIGAAAFIRAKSYRALLAALPASSRIAPTVGKITGLPAKFSPLVSFGWFAAFFASIHADIIPKYLDIACERIDQAQRQQRLFA